MRVQNWAVPALLAISALTVTGGTAAAAPAPPPAFGAAQPSGDSASGDNVEVRTATTGDSVTTTMTGATFALGADSRSVVVQDGAGRTIASVPLAFQMREQRYDVVAHIADDARTLTLRPVASAQPPVDGNAEFVASPFENQLAADQAVGNLALIGFFAPVAGIIGAALVGLVVGVIECAALTIGCVLTAVPTVLGFMAVGGAAGTILILGPTILQGLWTYIQTVLAPPGQSQFAGQGGMGGPDDAGVPNSQFRGPTFPPMYGGLGSGSAG
ncbi:hypothetical protein [Nocardia sp. alder85J]|uniref:hypothetical protein n=1 Tax=Nocardia sp. alder85J TaxID=2862949 RepID=UPI001CD6E08F|nr:hypothetical protein [Nocardia sp. alder85J]MCX4091091.1 hypothetical protein [Nocardia sp. alder85J]